MKMGSGVLNAKLVPTDKILPSDRMRMFRLMQKYYHGVTQEIFDNDLNRKMGSFILRDTGSNEIQGFSTIFVREMNINGKACQAIFSGDTIIEEGYWGQRALQRAFARFLYQTKFKRPFQPLYWFLISKGYKTYLLLANNFFIHYPRYEKPIPPHMKATMDLFYGDLYPKNYQPDTGLIVFDGDACRLKTGVADLTPELTQKNRRIAFFERANPEWRSGIELACAAEVTWLTPGHYIAKTILKRPLSWFRTFKLILGFDEETA